MDDFAAQFLDVPDTEEARAWLSAAPPGQFRSLGEEGSTESSLQLVDEIYAAGAEEVLAVEIDREGDMQNTGKLLIGLPENSAGRGSVLFVAGQIAESQGFDAEPDTGQHYIFVMLD